MNMLNIYPAVVAEQTRHRHKLTSTRSLEVPGPGAVAHMSLHQKSTMSKNHQTVIADSDWFPDLHRGTGYPFYVGDRSLRWRWKPSAPRRWSPSMRGSGFGQRVFAILFHSRARTPEIRHFSHFSRSPLALTRLRDRANPP